MIAHTTLETVNTFVNGRVRWCEDVYQRGYCTTTWNPGTYGDCKQFATLKLAMLLRMGAKPKDFTIWIVRKPGDRTNHAVLVVNATGEILDTPGAWVCGQYGCSRSNQITTRKVMEKHDRVKFLTPCEACAWPARRLAKEGKL
jgi:hypothetical protein